jgi:hypothetical protein
MAPIQSRLITPPPTKNRSMIDSQFIDLRAPLRVGDSPLG